MNDRPDEEPVIRLRDVRKSFGKQEVLRGVTFDVRRGNTLGLMGGSGSGKSVTLRHLVGLMRADSGTVEIEGRDIAAMGRDELVRLRKRMGFVFQEGALVNWLTVAENLALPLEEGTSLKRAEIDDKVAEKLELVHIPDAGGKLPSEISGGMKKRVGLARALITDPDVVMYDEPNAGLDPEISRSINDLIVEIGDRLNSTAIVVEHRVECIRRTCDEVVFLDKGRALVHEPADAFFRSSNERLRSFLGPEAD